MLKIKKHDKGDVYMKLVKLNLENYRSFGPSPTSIDISDLTALIGSNSAGKTTVLSAILKLFGESKDIKRTDFHVLHNQTPEEIVNNYFKIEAKFEFYKENDENDDYSIPLYFENFIVSEPGGNPYIRILLHATWQKSNDPEGSIDYRYYYIQCPEGEIQEEHLKPISAHDRSKIKVIYVPAVRNPSEQLKNASGTILWRILKQINWKKSDQELIKEKIELLDTQVSNQQGISTVKSIIADQWKHYHNDQRYSNANIKFGSNDLENILKKLDVEFTPSHTEKAFKVTDLGDGLKSLFYLTLIDSLLELENKAIEEITNNVEEESRVLNIDPPALTIVLVEEPENHVSPHLLGKVMKNLKSLGDKPNSQILITSHSPSIIKRIEPTQIRHLRIDKDESKTIVKGILLPSKESEAFKYVKEAVKAYPELYFSSLVILGEGDSEEILLPKFLTLFNDDLDSIGISVVPLGGRHVNHFWKLLTQLNIPFITLLDLDRERDGGGWGRIKYALKQLIENGIDKNELLRMENGEILEDQNLDKMHEWSLDKIGLENLTSWVNYLEGYNIYFSNPLDIDFMMLENFLDKYLMILKQNEGPLLSIDEDTNKRIHKLSEEEKNTGAYVDRINDSIRKTLKENGGNGGTYTVKQKELMIWYNYFFLTRGKPVTHIQALSLIEDQELKEYTPHVVKKIAEKIKMILNL
jgi:putative ATP-dependent endonuclease of the OLD family